MPDKNNEGLRLLEKQPNYGKVTVLIGPDGGGKTYLSNKLHTENPEAILIDGTHPQNWPVSDEKKKSLARLKEMAGNDPSFDYYGILGLELHKVIYRLVKEGKDVIVDSEQAFKWLMWEDMKGNLDKSMQILTSKEFNVILPDTVKYVVPQADSFEKQAELIWEQQNKKHESEKSLIDPKNLEEVKLRLKASENVVQALEKAGVVVEGKPAWLEKQTYE